MIFRSILPSTLSAPITKRHVERRILATPAAHLFAIIQDVNRYSEFLPLCSHSAILSEIGREGGLISEEKVREFRATLTVGFVPPMLTETYTSHVKVFPMQYRIHTKSVQSKWLDSLESTWQLTPHDPSTMASNANGHNSASSLSHCHVDFCVSLQASDPLIVQTLDQVLEHVARQQVDAFEQRCRQMPFHPPTTKPLSP